MNNKKSECVFCNIINNKISSIILHKYNNFFAIFDSKPINLGHILLISKYHYENIYDIPNNLAAESIVIAKKIIMKMKNILKCDGYNIILNNGKSSGQMIFHYHVHLIPRNLNDNVKFFIKHKKILYNNKKNIKILKNFLKK